MESEYPNVNDASNEAPKSILDLNVHCLLKVFDNLYIIDMINLGETCTLLRRVLRSAVIKFKEFDFLDYKRYVRSTERRPLSVEKILSYVNNHIESLNMFGSVNRLWIQTPADDECNFKKLKSLTISNSGILKWINAHNLEKLKINQLQRSDLNNFAYGMTKLKHFKLSNFDNNVPASELLYFLERNLNIERLIFGENLLFKIRNVNFSMFRNLKTVELHVGTVIPNLRLLLEIQELTNLKMQFNSSFLTIRNAQFGHNNIQKINRFLRAVTQKNTLKSLELICMHFADDRLIDAFSNLVSLSLANPRSYTNICSTIGNTLLPNLLHLEIRALIMEVRDILHLMEHLKTLEQLTVQYMPGFNSQPFLQQLRHFLRATTRNRPILLLKNIFIDDTVKIFFDLRCYEIIKNTHGNGDNSSKYRKMFEPVHLKDSDLALDLYE